MASTAKRLGEDKFFSGAFVVFCHISVIFRTFCLVVFKNFVYLQAMKGDSTICFSRRKQSGTMKENKLSLKLKEKVKLLIWR